MFSGNRLRSSVRERERSPESDLETRSGPNVIAELFRQTLDVEDREMVTRTRGGNARDRCDFNPPRVRSSRGGRSFCNRDSPTTLIDDVQVRSTRSRGDVSFSSARLAIHPIAVIPMNYLVRRYIVVVLMSRMTQCENLDLVINKNG